MSRLLFFLLIFSAVDGLAAPGNAPLCAATFAEGDALRGQPCRCDASVMKGPVWGTQTFTPQSSICRAAMHVGLIGSTGGTVSYAGASGCRTYAKRLRNGVQTGEHTAHPKSYYFPARQSGRCGGQVKGTPCPTNFVTMARSRGDMHCGCDASMVVGRVEGDGVYTAETPICAAAVHAGAMKDGEGQVRVRRASPCSRIGGVTRNGIRSEYVKVMGLAYFFPDLGPEKCPGRADRAK